MILDGWSATRRQSRGFGPLVGQMKVFLGVYLVSVSGGYQADLRAPGRPNRNSAKTHPCIEIWGISCVSNDIRLSSGGESPPLRHDFNIFVFCILQSLVSIPMQ